MAIRYICDRCQKQYPNQQDVVKILIPHQNTHLIATDTFPRDLCRSCLKGLHEWVKETGQ